MLVFDPISEPGVLDITVTAQNKQPYFGEIIVSSPNGPYVTVNNIELNLGDDEVISIGETINMQIEIENVGSENAYDISINLTESTFDTVNLIAADFTSAIITKSNFLNSRINSANF